MIIMGDGISTVETRQMHHQADLLREEGVSVFSMSAGRKINEAELKYIANKPSEEFYFKIGRYRQLIIQVKTFIGVLCERELPQTSK